MLLFYFHTFIHNITIYMSSDSDIKTKLECASQELNKLHIIINSHLERVRKMKRLGNTVELDLLNKRSCVLAQKSMEINDLINTYRVQLRKK